MAPPLSECPVCNKPSAPRSANPAHPFCSPRCRMVDLGKWLGEEYRLPDKPSDDREDELPALDDEGQPDRDRSDA
jgi:uncharacterized protein